jgi:hypothetical protein
LIGAPAPLASFVLGLLLMTNRITAEVDNVAAAVGDLRAGRLAGGRQCCRRDP